jgi:hypothetical protein
MEVFLSVGRTSTQAQEDFVTAVEKMLRAQGLEPRTAGRTSFSSDQPLKHIRALMQKCVGTVIIAFERIYIERGVDRRGNAKATDLDRAKLPTVWNQVEAALAYAQGHPLLVIVENGVKSEGLLEKGYDWYVQWVDINPGALNEAEFHGVLADWKQKLGASKSSALVLNDSTTIGQLIAGMKPSHLWSTLAALAAVIGTVATLAFQVGKSAAANPAAPPASSASYQTGQSLRSGPAGER